jgi:hypothetical protein
VSVPFLLCSLFGSLHRLAPTKQLSFPRFLQPFDSLVPCDILRLHIFSAKYAPCESHRLLGRYRPPSSGERERQSPNQQQLANTKHTHTHRMQIEHRGSRKYQTYQTSPEMWATLVAGGRGRWWNEEVYADVCVPIRVRMFGCERRLACGVCVKLCRGLWCVLCVCVCVCVVRVVCVCVVRVLFVFW